MFLFNKLVIGFIGCSTLALFVSAAGAPIDRTTHAPQAAFLIPDAVPEVIGVNESQLQEVIDENVLITAGSLSTVFFKINYNLRSVRGGQGYVPRLFVTRLPNDMRRIGTTKKRKELFLQTVLPLILRANDEILAERKNLMKLSKLVLDGIHMKPEDRLWLAVMEDRYKVRRGSLDELVLRMDIIPPSLALAQAAEESGWGTSRFVTEGNALFGQWTEDSDRGLVPARRVANRSYRIKSFECLLDGVRAYIKNLNTHHAYRSFRANRWKARQIGHVLEGQKLSQYLLPYSERGEEYIRSLQTIIKSNNLEKLDRAKLRDTEVRMRKISVRQKPVI